MVVDIDETIFVFDDLDFSLGEKSKSEVQVGKLLAAFDEDTADELTYSILGEAMAAISDSKSGVSAPIRISH